MWIWSLDDRLINVDLVESIELLEVYADNVDPAQLDAGAAEPEAFELVAVMVSGQETLLFDTDDVEVAYKAYEALAELVARGALASGVAVTKPFSVIELIDADMRTQN